MSKYKYDVHVYTEDGENRRIVKTFKKALAFIQEHYPNETLYDTDTGWGRRERVASSPAVEVDGKDHYQISTNPFSGAGEPLVARIMAFEEVPSFPQPDAEVTYAKTAQVDRTLLVAAYLGRWWSTPDGENIRLVLETLNWYGNAERLVEVFPQLDGLRELEAKAVEQNVDMARFISDQAFMTFPSDEMVTVPDYEYWSKMH